MMEFLFFLYFMLKNISGGLVVIASMAGFMCVALCGISLSDSDADDYKSFRRWCVGIFSSIALITCLANALPSIKQLAFIFGVPAVINNEDAREIPSNVLKYLNNHLKEELEEQAKDLLTEEQLTEL